MSVLIVHRAGPAIGPDARARAVFLFKKSELEIAAGLRSHVAKNDWVIEHTVKDETFGAIARMVSVFGAVIEREAASSDFRAVNTDRDFETTINQTLESLLDEGDSDERKEVS